MNLEMARLAEVAGPAKGLKEGADDAVSTAGVAAARRQAASAVAGGNLQTGPAAVVAPGKQLPTAAADHHGADTGADTDVPLVAPAADPGTRAAAVDAVFRVLLQGGGAPLPSPAGGSVGVASALGDLVKALGLGDGRDAGEVPGPAVGNLAAGGPVLFALLGATWGARFEDPESRKSGWRPRG
jgi:hypothetical protein